MKLSLRTALLRAAVTLAVLPGLAASAAAQWGPLSSGKVPLTADGEPDLDAPAPRTPEGRPDLSGVWRGPNVFARNESQPADGPPLAGFLDVAANMEGGLPLRPEAKALLDERVADNSAGNPEAHCLPMGLMQFHTQGAPRQFIQTPEVLVILYEASSGVRQIFTDGRPLPDNDPQPWWYGYSVGRWDGDELVVTTTGLVDGGWLDIRGSPRTDAATITERIRRPTYGRMEIDVTVDDPKAYTEPWTVRVNQTIMPDDSLIEFICQENQRFGTQ